MTESSEDTVLVTDDYFAEARASASTHSVVILRPGPRFSAPKPDPTDGVTSIVLAHAKRTVAMHLAGFLPVVCPIGGGTDVAGVSVFAATLDETRAILDADPASSACVSSPT